MTPEQYQELQESLDILLAAYISHTNERPSNVKVMDLMRWVNEKTKGE